MTDDATPTPEPETSAPAAPARTSEGEWREVGDRVWVCTCEPATVNVGLVAGEQGVLLVDTGSTPEQGRRLAASAAALVGRPVTHVVVTHAHFDHYFGLAGVQTGDVVGLGHESLVQPGEDAAEDAGRLGVDVADLVAPNSPMSIVRAIDLGGRRVEAVVAGPAHSEGDVMVFVPDARVVFTGDLLEIGADPYFGPDGSPGRWPSALDLAIGAGNDETTYVPGHGEPVDRFRVMTERANVSMVYGQGEMLARHGVKLAQALDALDHPTLDDGSPHPGASEWDWPYSTETIKAALPLVYAELAAKGVEARTQLPLLGGAGRH